MFFYPLITIAHFFVGDVVWFLLYSLSVLIGWLFGSLVKKCKYRLLARIILAVIGVAAVYMLHADYCIWYDTPLGEHMNLIIP